MKPIERTRKTPGGILVVEHIDRNGPGLGACQCPACTFAALLVSLTRGKK